VTFGLPVIAEIASEAPTLTADDVVAAYVYEAERPPTGGRAGEDSCLILSSGRSGWEPRTALGGRKWGP
jgi:hypothetical protein